MVYTSITTAGGVVVVTQVFPQGEEEKAAVPGSNAAPPPAPAGQAAPAVPAAPPSKLSDMTGAFLRGEPQALGIVQIFVGLMCVFLSLTALVSPTLIVHAPLCLGLAFVLSGSLAVAARRGTAVPLIRATLSCSLLSVLLALLAAAYLCWLIATRSGSEDFCREPPANFDTDNFRTCYFMVRRLNMVLDGLRGLVLVLLVLEVCVAVSLSVFSARALSRRGGSAPRMVAVESCGAPTASPSSLYDSDVALLDSVQEETAREPPPYSP